MQVKTVKLNFILNMIRLFLGTAFIILTTPYIARVLGPDKLGRVEYANSIITYFMLFTAFGISSYGIREVAKYRDDIHSLTKLVSELFLLLVITTVIGYMLLVALLFFNKNLLEIKDVILIIGINIFFNNIGFEWFYQGIENQIYITKRFVLVRILTLISLFIFIKTKEDYLIYAFIMVMMQSGSNILNFINLRKYIKIKEINFKELNIRQHIKPMLVIFSASLATTIYLQLDSIMIGNVSKEAVGIYTVPNRLIRLMLILITALGSVLLPRISNCLKNKDNENYNKYMNYSLNYIFLFSIPMVVACFLLSNEIIAVMAGSQYKASVLTLKILSPILFTIGLAYFLGFQLLYPLGKEKYYTLSVVVAAGVNFIFNYLMIPKYLQNGAAMGTVIAELIGPLITLYYSRKYLKGIEFFSLKRLKYFVASLMMGISIVLIQYFNLENIITIILSMLFSGGIYFISLIIMKEDIVMEGIGILRKRLKR